MNEAENQINEIAQALESLCSYIEVRHDKNGPFIFAFGHKDTHSLQLRKVENQFVLQLWHGRNSEEEVLTAEPSFPDEETAIKKAKEWLMRDAV